MHILNMTLVEMDGSKRRDVIFPVMKHYSFTRLECLGILYIEFEF